MEARSFRDIHREKKRTRNSYRLVKGGKPKRHKNRNIEVGRYMEEMGKKGR
jgi:hypothetical protein